MKNLHPLSLLEIAQRQSTYSIKKPNQGAPSPKSKSLSLCLGIKVQLYSLTVKQCTYNVQNRSNIYIYIYIEIEIEPYLIILNVSILLRFLVVLCIYTNCGFNFRVYYISALEI